MNKKGFTLVEIMVVVAIIIILVAIAILAGDSARKVARDNQRRTDIQLLQVKLETYRGEKGVYPGTNGLSDLLSPSFVSAIPQDPTNDTTHQYIYIPLQFSSGACGGSYYLYATLENSNNDSAKNVDYQKNPPVPSLTPCGGSFPTFGPTIYDVTSPNLFPAS